MSTACLHSLPSELLHQILTYLDIETIVFQFRSVCKRFHAVANAYNSYHFDFESISRPHFYQLCQLIPFKQVLSLTLSNKDKTRGQVPLFLSLVPLDQFTRLRSLNLHHIESDDLTVFLNSISHLSLTYLRIDCQTLSVRKNTALDRLSAAIEHSSLAKLDLNLWPKDLSEVQWPFNATIRYLRIRSSLTLTQFYRILEHCPCLGTVVAKDFDATEQHKPVSAPQAPFHQLKSLTCIGGRIQMNKLDLCLSSTPSLVHLKLIGHGSLFTSAFDGCLWEQLICTKLPLLEKFEIHIAMLTDIHFDTRNINEIISLFRTPFWLDEKHCSVTCDYIIYLHRLVLYSVPVCHQHVEYYSNDDKVSASNFSTSNDSSSAMDGVRRLDIDLSVVLNKDEIPNTNNLRFGNVNDLTVCIDGEWPVDSSRFLSSTVDLSRLVKLSLYVNFSYEYMPGVIRGAKELLSHTVNVLTVTLLDYGAPETCTTTMEAVCSIMTSNVKHLRVRVKSSDDVKFIVESLGHLLSVTFEHANYLRFDREELVKRLSELKRGSTTWQCQQALHLWLD